MQIRQKFIVFKNPVDTPSPYEIDFTRSDLLKIQISGSGSCDIKIYGKINPDSDYAQMAIIKDSDYSFIDTISETGVYTISATGYYKLKIETNSADNTITCVASEVVEA
jgi:hypothetical protein